MRCPRAKPYIKSDRLLSDIDGILKSGNLSCGKFTRRFEKEFADYVGTKHAVAVSSGTAALEVTLYSLGLPALVSYENFHVYFSMINELIQQFKILRLNVSNRFG